MHFFLWTLLGSLFSLFCYQLKFQVTATHSLKQNVAILIKLSHQPVPEFISLYDWWCRQWLLQVLKIVYPKIKSGSPMLKVAMTCLNRVVPGQSFRQWPPGPPLILNTVFTRYGEFHVKDKTTSLYWDAPWVTCLTTCLHMLFVKPDISFLETMS